MSCADCMSYSEIMMNDKGEKICPECYHKRYYRKPTQFAVIAPAKKKSDRELMLDLKRQWEKKF